MSEAPETRPLIPRPLADLAARAAAQAGDENFPVALSILPPTPREQLMRLYSFARFVDDVGDEAEGDRLHLLDLVEQDVRALWTGRPVLPVVANLRPLVAVGVPVEPFLGLVEANRVDQTVTRYETFDELLHYCTLSANPVGRVVLYIADAVTPDNLDDSDAVCSGLQVVEHCQDVGEDYDRGRIYLPGVDLREYDVAESQLAAAAASPDLRRVVARQCDRAEVLLDRGSRLVRRLHGWSRVAVAGYVAGGRAAIDAIRRVDHDVLAHQVTPRRSRTALEALRLLAGVP